MEEEKVYVKATCNGCGKEYLRHLSKDYINKHGKATCGSYCRACNYERAKARRGRTTEEMMTHSTYEKMGCRLLSKAEIAELEPLYSTRALKKKRESLPYYR